MPINIGKKEDLEEAAVLEKNCFSDAWSLESLKDMADLRTSYILTLREDGKLLGYLIAQLVMDEGELLRIGTDPEARNKGIGGRLLRFMLADCRETELWRLDVRESNAAAIALYEKYGFKKVVKNKDFYESPREDGWMMEKHMGKL